MKKLILLAVLLTSNMMLAHAQDSIVLYIADRPESREVCIDDHDVFIIHAREGYEFMWTFDGYLPNSWDSPIIISDQLGNYFPIQYTDDGGFSHYFSIRYKESHVPTSFTHTQWKHQSESDSLVAVEADSIGWPAFYQFLWSTGETTRTIEVNEPGTYTCEISELCGTATRTFIMKDNVELYRATVDLASGLNKVTWQTTPAQAEYISQVKVERDGFVVGTVPYEDGQFMDNIGSENAARNYRLTGITTEGEDCPIESYEKGTIHTTYYEDVNVNLNMTWNIPYVEEGAQGTLTCFQICKYDPNTEEITVVDQVNAAITDYTCGVNQFDGGYAVIAAVFNDGKGLEELSFSNLTTDILGMGENAETAFRIYPNPAKDRVNVEGTGLMTITNALGQTILTMEIDGKETVELPKGMYFVKLNGVVRKIVVE